LLAEELSLALPPPYASHVTSNRNAVMGNLRIGPYVAFVSKFWAVEDVITTSDMWMGPKLAIGPEI
jgi:hypothetical protein